QWSRISVIVPSSRVIVAGQWASGVHVLFQPMDARLGLLQVTLVALISERHGLLFVAHRHAEHGVLSVHPFLDKGMLRHGDASNGFVVLHRIHAATVATGPDHHAHAIGSPARVRLPGRGATGAWHVPTVRAGGALP